jgi:hypothetical protein
MSSTVGEGGFTGLAPTVGVIRRNSPRLAPQKSDLAERLYTLLVGYTITNITFEEHSLTLHLSSGEVFVMQNSEGFMES